MEDTLRAVKAAGLRRRRTRQTRRRLGLAAAVVAVVAVGIGVLPDDHDRVTTAGPVSRSDERAIPSTTKAPEVLGMVIEKDPASTDTTAAVAVPTTTAPPSTADSEQPPATASACRDSLDPACGEFHWDPAPAVDQPLTLSAEPVPTLAPGQSTELVIHWTDPDALISFFDSDADGALLADACVVEPRYGPWTPPAPDGGSGTFTIAYTAPATPGPTSVMVVAATGVCDGYHPYHSDASILIPITVE